MTPASFVIVFLIVTGLGIEANESITLYKHRAVNQTIGPEDAIYCQLVDPKGNIVFDSFGKCNLVVERVSMDHHGEWQMSVGLPERILLESHRLSVTVLEEEKKPEVITYVAKQRPVVTISCSVSSPYPINACKFRDPSGKILIAAPGVGQDRYIYHGTEVKLESGLSSHECGLRIVDPLTSDLGLWRCAMETAHETYYGFLPVLCPWALQDPEIQAMVTTEPTLTSERTEITAQEGDSVTMSCYVQAPIRYCYFRRQNGTTFSVSPGTSTPTMEYVGAGFDSGECGVRFHNLLATDAGTWSCTVALHNETTVEQRVSFSVDIEPLMTARHYFDNGNLLVDATINAVGTLDYCRFVRMDGFGFTSENVPEGYTFMGSLASKNCALIIHEPTILNLHPWAVAAKIVGQDEEISRTTTDNLLVFEEEGIGAGGPHHPWHFWVFIALIAVLLVLAGAACGPKKNREWALSRATMFRNSMRNSLRKEPLPPQAPITPEHVAPIQQQNV